jgi:hypothetical protein
VGFLLFIKERDLYHDRLKCCHAKKKPRDKHWDNGAKTVDQALERASNGINQENNVILKNQANN